MENLQDMLLEHVVPDQRGELGRIAYSFTEMKIVQVHWPKVSTVDGVFVATNGALRLHGKYQLQRPGVLGYNKSGEFVFDLGAICLSIREHTTDSHGHSPRHRNTHTNHHHHPDLPNHLPNHRHHGATSGVLRDVTCTVGHIKVKFYGGAAKICQFLTSLYIKMYRRHLEAQIAQVIQETVKDDGQLLLSALSVMAAMNGNEQPAVASRTPTPSPSHSMTASLDQRDDSMGRIQRFLDSFRRRSTEST